MKGKKFKPKLSKYVLNLEDMDITILCNHIKEAIFDIKEQVKDCDNVVDIEYLLYEKYALMRVNKQLGFSTFNPELDACKNIKAEAEKIFKENLRAFKDNSLPSVPAAVVDSPSAAALVESEDTL